MKNIKDMCRMEAERLIASTTDAVELEKFLEHKNQHVRVKAQYKLLACLPFEEDAGMPHPDEVLRLRQGATAAKHIGAFCHSLKAK